MIVYANIKTENINLYHVNNWKRRTETDEYKKLKDNIKKNGILDPVLIEDFPEQLRIEIGEQRLLVAKELNIDSLDAFVYNKCQDRVVHAEGQRMTTLEEIREKFRNSDVITYKVIKKYINSGVIQWQ